MSYRVLITGAGGMLGKALCAELDAKGVRYKATTRDYLDVTDHERCLAAMLDYRPNIIFHLAAYTDVDACEKDFVRAVENNDTGTYNIAIAAEIIKAMVIYVSTDHVFDGARRKPYPVWSYTDPVNKYGFSKLGGEHHLQNFCSSFVIVRTSWLYGPGRSNFVDSIIEAAKTNKEIRVVDDEISSPTYVKDLAEKLVEIMYKVNKNNIIHACNEWYCSRYEQAQFILNCIKSDCKVIPVSQEEYGRLAMRPSYSVLETNLRSFDIVQMRTWQAAMVEFIGENHGQT